MDQCIQEYLKMAPEIFPIEGLLSGSTIARLARISWGTQRFGPTPLEKAIKGLVAQATGDENTMMRQGASSTQQCKV